MFRRVREIEPAGIIFTSKEGKETMRESFYNYYLDVEGKRYLFNILNGGLLQMEKNITKEEQQYLYQNGFYVDDDKDEVETLEREVNANIEEDQQAMELTIALTNQCNFHCIYCYQDKNKKEMATDTADALICKICTGLEQIPYKRVLIHYFGGEPLLNIKLLLYLHEAIKKVCAEKGVKYVSFITTNGQMLSIELIKKVQFDYIQMTFEGRGERHDELRKSDNFHFEDEIRLLENILVSSNSCIILRMNACAENREEILPFYKHIFDTYGCERFQINLNRMIKYHPEDPFEMLSQKEYAELYYELMLLKEQYTGEFELPVALKMPCKFLCGCAYSISTDGYCTFCSGRVENKTTSFQNIDFSARKAVVFREECRKCQMLPICLGGCAVHHDLRVEGCTYEKYVLEKILRHFIQRTRENAK